ncbi:MAG: site-specific DNA-methyltransferase [Methylophaga sp.]|uniref:site-specific DNA-methyltransferase n=1 Tax=Methylophaga sp. TaxID=2024840 RepID=UPI00299E5959|nr:site-specific DNA-methyltransferase [Methylophaga sp.]MDX1749051.1 site-specific DNA-methyltransferase [Methylophaga sp.]
MDMERQEELQQAIIELIPADGAKVGNVTLKAELEAYGLQVTDKEYESAKNSLVDAGVLGIGRGKDGAVYLKNPTDTTELTLAMTEEPEEKAPANKKSTKSGPRKSANEPNQVLSYRYDEKRKNNPHVGMVDTHSDGVEEKTTWKYDPHLDPELQFDSSRAQVEKIIDDALASDNDETMRLALQELKRLQAPYLNWTGKAERSNFEVDTVSLHVHERIDPATILAGVQKRLKSNKDKDKAAFQADLFHAPFENLPLREAIDFYKHERDWANRLIAGDSLLVMNSLLQKEGMSGQIQMFYIDPPYGIKYGSNFQPFVNKKDVTDRKDEDLTQEPEMIKAFRDTWELGIHSYLTYLRDRLLLARELLNTSGSVFVQISDENLHHVREIMDETFGAENFVAVICYKKPGQRSSQTLNVLTDFVIWYAKDKAKIKYRQLYKDKQLSGDGGSHYSQVELSNGGVRPIKSEERLKPNLLPKGARVFQTTSLTSAGSQSGEGQFIFRGKILYPPSHKHWSCSTEGLHRLAKVNRIEITPTTIRYKRYFDDLPIMEIDNRWDDVGLFGESVYVVQTGLLAIERCILMTTDPGDLVLDPTCGSGTTAFISEKLGRRWITTDTSRVSTTITKQRLMTASYDYYELKYPHEGLTSGFIYKTSPRVTLKSIANNPEIDEIYLRDYPEIESKLAELNKVLGKEIEAWQVPFDFPSDWPEASKPPFESFQSARQVMQKRMDASIAAHAGQEILYDQPVVSKNKLRITGPFTVEAVPFATVLGLEEAEQPKEADSTIARSGATSRHSLWREELLKAGIRGKGGQQMKLQDLETLPDTHYIDAVGTLMETGERVAVSFGPEHAALEQRQVEIAMREAGELFPLPKLLVFCAFTFDPEAAKDIDNIKGIQALKVQMNTDLLTEDLKKGRASNESFWLMGQPDVELHKHKDGKLQVEVHGFDYFDTKTGELKSGGKKNIAMWQLDTDYDNRSLFPRQVFFPMAGKKDGWNRLKKDIRAELNEDLLESFHGTKSLPFEAGDNRCIAVKIVDDRGIESLKVIRLEH